MKKRLFLLILSAIFITAVTISFIIGSFSRSFVEEVFRENREEKFTRIKKQLEHYQTILHSVEKEMNTAGGAGLLKLRRQYPSAASIFAASPDELKKSAERAGVEEVYFINSEGVVFNSSLKRDIGLNLLEVSPSFSKYIKGIYGRGEVVSQGINVSINEGKINHYMYYSPKGSSIIYEISMDASEFIRGKYNFALYEFLFRDMFKSFYGDYLHSIDMYTFVGGEGRSLINEGKIFHGSRELVREIISRGESFVEDADTLKVYKRLSFNKFFFNSASRIYLELVYDTSSLKDYSISVLLLSLLSVIFITIIMFFLSSRRLNTIFISRINLILEGVGRIKTGAFNAPINDRGKDEIGDIASAIDDMARTITRRTDDLGKTNEQLRELTVFMNSIIESIPSALITIDNSDRIVHWNRGALEIFGIPGEKARGMILWELLPYLARFKQACEDVRINRRSLSFFRETVTVDSLRIVNISIIPFWESGVSGMVLRIDDITDSEKKEAQLERAKKAEMLGTMAGGLAHDFNNIITGIVSTASYLSHLLKSGSAVKSGDIEENLEIIRKSGLKASGLVKKLMSFKNRDLTIFEKTDLVPLLKDAAGLASHLTGDIDIKMELPEGEAFIMADRAQIEQVFLNLFVNAAEAINDAGRSEKGIITVSLNKVEPGAGDEKGGPFLWHAAVSDNGPGINREIIDTVFDPFVSSKEAGGGLGLAVVNSVITEHEGIIEVDSGPEGTRFDIYIPAAEF
jgi:PAS domain S-box-containing protein